MHKSAGDQIDTYTQLMYMNTNCDPVSCLYFVPQFMKFLKKKAINEV